MDKADFKKNIKTNIEKRGHHITIVSGKTTPRFAYTIGGKNEHGFELILAGAITFFKDDVITILNGILEKMKYSKLNVKDSIEVDHYGSFRFKKVHPSWSELTMLGVYDYYNIDSFDALQVIPSKELYTLDIPEMAFPWDREKEPIWKWLKDEWEYEIPENSDVVTNLDALNGRKVTEIMRWETDQWEMFAGSGPDVFEKDMRVVPIGVMLGIDKSIEVSLDLKVGTGFWREENGTWNSWVPSI